MSDSLVHAENPYAAPSLARQGVVIAEICPSAPFHLSGAIPPSDLRHAARLAVLHPRSARLLFAIVTPLLLAVTAFTAYQCFHDREFLVYVGTTIAATAAGIAAIAFCSQGEPERARTAPSSHQIIITDDAIHTLSESENITQRWSTFTKFRASDRVVLLFLDAYSPVRVLSRALFPHDGEWFRFLDFVRMKLPEG